MQRLPSRGKTARPSRGSTATSTTTITDADTSNTSTNITVATSPDSIESAYNGEEADITTTPTPPATNGDVFETPSHDGVVEVMDEDINGTFESGYEELPIEIQSLMERFLESLVLKTQPSPLSIDRLSELYQDFYEHAHSQINTHIAAESAKISRDASPAPSMSSGRSSISRGLPGRRRPPDKRLSVDAHQPFDHQMLTASEVTDRRKARRQLEVKRIAMEEAVERGVCEKVYPRLWRHQSTDDEARDEKLRSRAAALAVVGVDLKELLSTALSNDAVLSTALEKSDGSSDISARDRLTEARTSLRHMNDERYPLGKLNHLAVAHKAIVEALQHLYPSASSADEVLPTLIYTVIISDPQSNSVVSNLNFIQRFRTASKIDGETAYCLVNLEAAISFLETVDLSSIRANEPLQGPLRSPSQPSTPRSEIADPMYRGLPSSQPTPERPRPSPSTPEPHVSKARPRASSGLHPFEAASDAVRSGANDIHNALDGGFKFLFGRLREKQAASSPIGSPMPSAPKTLEDARKLVSQEENADDLESLQDVASVTESKDEDDGPDEDTMTGISLAERALKLIDTPSAPLNPYAAMKPRQRPRLATSNSTNIESTKSGRSSSVSTASTTTPAIGAANASYNPVDSVRNLGNALNPFRGFGGMGTFGRRASAEPVKVSGSSSPTNMMGSSPLASKSTAAVSAENAVPAAHDTNSNGNLAAHTGLDWSSIAPPIERFVHCKDVMELNGFDVDLLLRDYQRLVGAFEVAKSARHGTDA